MTNVQTWDVNWSWEGQNSNIVGQSSGRKLTLKLIRILWGEAVLVTSGCFTTLSTPSSMWISVSGNLNAEESNSPSLTFRSLEKWCNKLPRPSVWGDVEKRRLTWSLRNLICERQLELFWIGCCQFDLKREYWNERNLNPTKSVSWTYYSHLE